MVELPPIPHRKKTKIHHGRKVSGKEEGAGPGLNDYKTGLNI